MTGLEEVRFRGECLGQPVFGALFPDVPSPTAFKGLAGHMIIGDGDNADVRVSEPSLRYFGIKGCDKRSYSMEVADKRGEWNVTLSGRLSDENKALAEISCNGVAIAIAPSQRATRTEGARSLAGLTRRMWGDWIATGGNPLPSPAIVASLCCVAFHTSALGDFLLHGDLRN